MEDKFQLKYSIGLQVPMKNGERTEYRTSQFNGSILVADGHPETIITNGENSLSLGIEKVADEKK
jgi:hypothetical protein